MRRPGVLPVCGTVMAFCGVFANAAMGQETDNDFIQDFEKPDVEALQKQIEELKNKVDSLEKASKSDATGAKANSDQDNNFKLDWVPGPRFSSNDDQFRFELNGRITYDYSNISFKDGDGVERPDEKINGTNLRSLRMGFRGRVFGNFNYRLIADFSDNEVDVKIAFIDYRFGNSRIVVGHTRLFNTLDQTTPPTNSAFAERAAFIRSIGVGRRVGVGASHSGKDWSVSGGYFFESIATGNSSLDDSNMYSGRVNYSPQFENGVGLHFGASAFYRNENGVPYDQRYRTRPLVNQGKFRPLASEELSISSEVFYGGEFVTTYKSFAFQAEYGILKNSLSDIETQTSVNPNYNGGYFEISFFPTGAERTIDGSSGRFRRVKIDNPVGAGGMGEVRLAARYDIADFTHETFGRKQKSMIFGVDWYLNDVMKIQGNYAYTTVKNAANIKTDTVNTFNLRTMINF